MEMFPEQDHLFLKHSFAFCILINTNCMMMCLAVSCIVHIEI